MQHVKALYACYPSSSEIIMNSILSKCSFLEFLPLLRGYVGKNGFIEPQFSLLTFQLPFFRTFLSGLVSYLLPYISASMSIDLS